MSCRATTQKAWPRLVLSQTSYKEAKMVKQVEG